MTSYTEDGSIITPPGILIIDERVEAPVKSGNGFSELQVMKVVDNYAEIINELKEFFKKYTFGFYEPY